MAPYAAMQQSTRPDVTYSRHLFTSAEDLVHCSRGCHAKVKSRKAPHAGVEASDREGQRREGTVVWIPDSKTPNGIAEVPLTPLAVQAFQRQLAISGDGPLLFPSDLNPSGPQKNLRKAWKRTLSRAEVTYFRTGSRDMHSHYSIGPFVHSSCTV